jgi:hypothetical protein
VDGRIHGVSLPIAIDGNGATAYADRDRQQGTDRARSRSHQQEMNPTSVLNICSTNRDEYSAVAHQFLPLNEHEMFVNEICVIGSTFTSAVQGWSVRGCLKYSGSPFLKTENCLQAVSDSAASA